MAHDRLPGHIGWEIVRDHSRQFVRDIGPHLIMAVVGSFGRIDVEARAKAEVIGARRIVRHIVAARRCIRRYEDQPKVSACAAKLALFRHIRVVAGQPGQIPHDRELASLYLWWDEDRKGHLCSGGARRVLVHALHASEGTVGADLLYAHRSVFREAVCANLVARRITKIGGIGAGQVLAGTSGTFADASGRQTGGVESINLTRLLRRKADRHPIAGRGFAIAGPENQKGGLILTVENRILSELAEILDAQRR